MKKKVAIAFAAVAILMSSFMLGVYASNNASLWIDGTQTSIPVQIVDGKPYIPLSVAKNYFHAETGYNPATGKITLNTGKKSASASTAASQPATASKQKIGAPKTFNYHVNSADGVTLTWMAANLTGKTINYYTVNLRTLNPVGDPSYDEISGNNKFAVKYVGPVAPNDTLIVYKLFTYQGALQYIVIDSIDLVYSDGKKEHVTYAYKTSKDNGLG
ncbi:hypothetical protein SAMN02799624_06181 [Paenibacillus sp. UNC496MF]|uniref:hypothetical protein n=1 Tax=Paenibacillus sp. UNC496MF TaxID=1502753 RepID=UPI0008DFFDD2|nr:hypothetical protein [Paenibacillus sp. UNC496MF]SFJ83223.1 hypothetical protein SAMN02799624_06181 [Paenibacillus sp. UNC496MF]